MATVALQFAGQAVGSFLGGPLGGIIGRAAGAVAGSFIDEALFAGKPRRAEGSRLGDLRVMASTEGSVAPRLWGRMRLAGQVIWATSFEEVVSTRTESASAKGGAGSARSKVTEYSYFANFAVALAEGPVTRLGRAWADGKPIDLADFTCRFYDGSETQAPDSLIIAKEGADNAPAYRGLSYVVFERMPLAKFGNRLPQLSFEVFGQPGGTEELVRAVNVIPGSTEFGYDTEPVIRKLGEGETEPENAHASMRRSDWDVSIDALTASCRNLQAVSLVVAWFGTDVNCAVCEIRPGVETVAKVTRPEAWKTAGVARGDAHLVSTVDDRPAYGGTPSDRSVIRAIADLRARGLKTVFYPFILMDAPDYPWRGRLTCSPAPGEVGSPDKTAAAATQVSHFVGTAAPGDFSIVDGEVVYSGPAEWSLRRMILHYAKLCALAGGVDSFLIGSELRGLTTLRDGPASYPFVAALISLAADVRSILPDAEISYAADWSEYFGHHPQDGSDDVFFHLDPLWSSSNIDFIGIDNYMPLSDWRDGASHLDRSTSPSIYGQDYLKQNVAGGERYDWFYASDGDRAAQTRTPISDGAYGKPWVFRYKDILGWWQNAHHDRPGGVESLSPTTWTPRSKPVRFTEIGCPAIDKGGNQPNVFIDAKSSESAAPYFSSGARDDFMLHSYLRAISSYWGASGPHNPVSPLYGGPMVEPDLYFWAWDARPFPDFPLRSDVWADGANYARGHWLNGRIEQVPFATLVPQICAAYGFTDVEAGELEGLIDGVVADRIMSARDLLDPLAQVFSFDAAESEGKLKFRGRRQASALSITHDTLVETKPELPLYSLRRAQETELAAALKLSYTESSVDYRSAAVMTRKDGVASLRESSIDLPGAVSQAEAQKRCDVLLQEIWAGRETLEAVLPPSLMALEPGDVVEIDLGPRRHAVRLEQIHDGAARSIAARAHDGDVYDVPDAPARDGVLLKAQALGPPVVQFLDLPLAGEEFIAPAPWIAAAATPWPGRLNLLRKDDDASFSVDRVIEAPAVIGELLDTLPAGPAGVFDRAARVRVKLYSGALMAVNDAALLGGANAAAIGSDETGWEIVQFRDAELVGDRTYEIGWLLRGQRGSEPEMQASAPVATRFVLLDALVVQPTLSAAAIGHDITWRIGPQSRDHGDPAYEEVVHRANGIGLRPLSPTHLRGRRDGGDVVFSWLRRTRIDGDGWELPDVPLGEEREAYEIAVVDAGIVLRTAQATSPEWRYTAAQQAADFSGAPPADFTLRIAQLSTAYGRGGILERTLHV